MNTNRSKQLEEKNINTDKEDISTQGKLEFLK